MLSLYNSTFALFHSPVLSVRIRDTILNGSFGSRNVDDRIKRASFPLSSYSKYKYPT